MYVGRCQDTHKPKVSWSSRIQWLVNKIYAEEAQRVVFLTGHLHRDSPSCLMQRITLSTQHNRFLCEGSAKLYQHVGLSRPLLRFRKQPLQKDMRNHQTGSQQSAFHKANFPFSPLNPHHFKIHPGWVATELPRGCTFKIKTNGNKTCKAISSD